MCCVVSFIYVHIYVHFWPRRAYILSHVVYLFIHTYTYFTLYHLLCLFSNFFTTIYSLTGLISLVLFLRHLFICLSVCYSLLSALTLVSDDIGFASLPVEKGHPSGNIGRMEWMLENLDFVQWEVWMWIHREQSLSDMDTCTHFGLYIIQSDCVHETVHMSYLHHLGRHIAMSCNCNYNSYFRPFIPPSVAVTSSYRDNND